MLCASCIDCVFVELLAGVLFLDLNKRSDKATMAAAKSKAITIRIGIYGFLRDGTGCAYSG